MRTRDKFIVDSQPAKPGELSNRALHYSAFGHWHKATAAGWPAAHLMRETEPTYVPGEAPALALVRDDGSQASAPNRAPGQQLERFDPIMSVGRVDPTGENTVLYIGQNLALTAIDVLALVQTPVRKDARS